MLRGVKRGVLAALAIPGVATPFYPFMRGRATVFMLHRFRDPTRGIEGLDPAHLRRALALLRRRRYELVSLAEVFRRLRGEGEPLRRAVAFTIDDGYAEQAEVAGPLFAEFDCPVATFVTTGVLDGRLWFWWDRVTWILRHARRQHLEVEIPKGRIRLVADADRGHEAVATEFVRQCKTLPDPEKNAAIDALAAAAEVSVPAVPPPDSAPMTWEQLRACEARGMSFGPHTVTHPILSRTDDAQARREIAESWERLREQARSPVPIFCYPNGGWGDFGAREIAYLRAVGMTGAVVGAWGIADARQFTREDAPFRVRRIPFPAEAAHVIQYASGAEVVNLAVRGRLR